MITTIKEIVFDTDTLLKVRDFDCKWDTYGNLHLSKQWYLDRYVNKPAFIAYDQNTIIGYVGVLPIKKELYDTIINGVIYDDICVNPNKYLDDSLYIYMPSVLVDQKYRCHHIGSQLMEKFIDKYKEKYLCCITISSMGYKLISKYFQHKCNIIEGHDVFIKNP